MHHIRYPRLVEAFIAARWAVLPSTLHAIRDVLASRLTGEHLVAHDRPSARSAAKAALEAAPRGGAPGFQVVTVEGIIGKRLSSMEIECGGGCDIDDVTDALARAVLDPMVTAVVLELHTPGGVVTGVPELAAQIAEWSALKPIVAFTDTQCCSAGYWLASQCSAVYSTPSADLGSIGVYTALVDSSEAWAKEGFKLELLKAGRLKAAGIAGMSLSDEQRAWLQADVDSFYQQFTAAVRAGRTQAGASVDDETMQGQVFSGAVAATRGLVDECLPSRGAFYARMGELYGAMRSV